MRHHQQRVRNVSTLTSNCGSLRLRGTAQQISQKYTTLAAETDDRMLSEAYLQHAEHYNRIGDAQPC